MGRCLKVRKLEVVSKLLGKEHPLACLSDDLSDEQDMSVSRKVSKGILREK